MPTPPPPRNVPSMAPPSSQGGKEEIRGGWLKTYLLRHRHEQGEAAYLDLLRRAGVEASQLDDERGWISEREARKVLVLLVEAHGSRSVLRDRGQWANHPEALGLHVRMLRSAKSPMDAYMYLADNVREITRMGSLDARVEGPDAVCVTYTRRHDDDGIAPLRPEYESVFCAARVGELGALPTLWGLRKAEVVHPACLAKGADACIYHVRWQRPGPSLWQRLITGMALGLVAAAVLATQGPIAASLALVAGFSVGVAAAWALAWRRREATRRHFEANRIAALERGLELKGELGHTSAAGDLLGTVLGGKYRIVRKIGSGGIGMVYAAVHTGLGHEVAVKVLRGAAAKDGSEIARLRREAYIQTHVEHRNVVRVLDLDQMSDGSIYVVMERLHGRTLADVLAREGLVAPGLAIRVFLDVCRGLSAVHDKDVVHRDLKPGNIFLCDDGTVKVLDFGMSKLDNAEALTQAGYTLGTPEYMAPEQCIGAAVEPRTDLYALGVVMYEALVGRLPIASSDRRELLDLHQRKRPEPLRSVRPDLPIPEALEQAIMQCLEKKPAARPSSAAVLADQLAAIPLVGLPTSYSGSPSAREPVLPSLSPPETLSALPSSRVD